jgi:hypothetical protein
MKNIRLEPARTNGLWFVEIATGNNRKGTRRAAAVCDAVYTLAQAQAFCSNNRAASYALILETQSS